jgi:membrane-associated phospholipid phosphatase
MTTPAHAPAPDPAARAEARAEARERRQADADADADADAEVAADPFAVDLAVDLPIIGLTGAVFLGTEFTKDRLRWEGCHACDTSHLGPLDRLVLDNHNPAAKVTSDVFVYTAMSAPFVADLADVVIHKRGAKSWGKDALVLLEVMAVNFALTNTIKFAILRPRPFTYGLDGSDRDPTEGDSRLSFYSGHASTAFAMATAYGYLFQSRHPRSRWVAPVWVLSYGVASTTGVMRVTSGKHFWSDVIVGAVAGSAIGLAIPALHKRRPSKRRFAGPMRLNVSADRYGSRLALRGSF